VVATRAVPQNRPRPVIARVLHVQRVEDVLLKVIAVFFAADLLDDVAQQDITGVVILPFLAWLELERLVLREHHDLKGRQRDADGFRLFEVGEIGIARNARRMRKQVMDSDPLPGFRRALEIFRNWIIDAKLAFLLKLQNRCCGELLRNRAEPELRIRRVRHVPFKVGHPVRLF